MQPQFTIGQAVFAPSFVDCFGETQPQRDNMTVETITEHEGARGSYYRVLARYPDGYGYMEGAERYFTAYE